MAEGGGQRPPRLTHSGIGSVEYREGKKAARCGGLETPGRKQQLELWRQCTFCIMGQQVDPAGEPNIWEAQVSR